MCAFINGSPTALSCPLGTERGFANAAHWITKPIGISEDLFCGGSGTRRTATAVLLPIPGTSIRTKQRTLGDQPRVLCFVEVAGIEPASFVGDQGLLRAQPAVIFSAPTVTQASCRRAQLLFSVPHHPVAG